MLRKLDRLIARFERLVIGATMIVMTALIFVNVVMRYALAVTITWAEDLAIFLMIGMSFFAAAYGTRSNSHIIMSALYDTFTGRTRQVMYGFGLVLTTGLSAILFVFSIEVTHALYGLGGEIASMGLPRYLPYLAVVIALFLMALHFIHRLLRFFSSGRTDEELPE